MAHHARIVLAFEPNALYQSLPPVYGYEVTVAYEACPAVLCAPNEQIALEQLLDAIARTYVQDNSDIGEPLRVVSRVFKMDVEPESIKVDSFGATAPTPNATLDTVIHEFGFAIECDVKRHVEESEWLAGVRQRA